MKKEDLLEKIDYLIGLGTSTLATKWESNFNTYVDAGKFYGFRSASLSFIDNLYGKKHSYYTEFDSTVTSNYYNITDSGVNMLQSIRHEVQQGWLDSFRNIVAAEIFSDFLEMSKYLLDEKYKDAAAIMIGSTLEEHLRNLCMRHSIDTHFIKGGDWVPKKANLLNADLRKASVYGPLEEKSIIAWFDLRNSAAHGKYSDYSIEQVKLLYNGVLDFITRFK